MKWNHHSRQWNVTVTFLQVPLAAVFHFNSPYFTFKLPCGRQHNIQVQCFASFTRCPCTSTFTFLLFFQASLRTRRNEWRGVSPHCGLQCSPDPALPAAELRAGLLRMHKAVRGPFTNQKGRRKTASPTRLTLHARGSSGFRRAQRSGTSVWN